MRASSRAQDARACREGAGARRPSGPTSNTRVLLVEDDPPIGSGLEQGLKQEGFAVDCGMDGDAALVALRSTAYGLLLLDLWLSNRDGLAMLASLRRRDEMLPRDRCRRRHTRRRVRAQRRHDTRARNRRRRPLHPGSRTRARMGALLSRRRRADRDVVRQRARPVDREADRGTASRDGRRLTVSVRFPAPT
ncbi:response regulator [Burkholderia multivorans]|nr:response regulator [Burkholderia multivorans]